MSKLGIVVLVACGGGGESPPDSPSGCLDDSAFEPNESPATAFITPIGVGTFQFNARAAICPEQDVDVFGIDVSEAALRIEAQVNFADGVVVDIDLVGEAGQTLQRGTLSGNDRTIAILADPPVGRVFARVSTAGGLSNYTVNLAMLE